jgi:hypothetical protein
MDELGEQRNSWSGREERRREGAVDEGSIDPPEGQETVT